MSKGGPGICKGHGLRPMLLEFFERNPDELVDVETVAVKFNVQRKVAANTLSVLKAEGALKRTAGYVLNKETA